VRGELDDQVVATHRVREDAIVAEEPDLAAVAGEGAGAH
jgi:hypothetical protein